jgi:hypothetical protein
MAFDSLFKNMATRQGVLHTRLHIWAIFLLLKTFNDGVTGIPHNFSAPAANGNRIATSPAFRAKPDALNGK